MADHIMMPASAVLDVAVPASDADSREHHRVTWDGEYGTVTCTAPVGASCRLWCAEGCEEQCHGNPDGTPHRRTDHGECLPITWINAVGVVDSHWDDDADDPEPVPDYTDGAIITDWNGDDYQWCYAARPAPREGD